MVPTGPYDWLFKHCDFLHEARNKSPPNVSSFLWVLLSQSVFFFFFATARYSLRNETSDWIYCIDWWQFLIRLIGICLFGALPAEKATLQCLFFCFSCFVCVCVCEGDRFQEM